MWYVGRVMANDTMINKLYGTFEGYEGLFVSGYAYAKYVGKYMGVVVPRFMSNIRLAFLLNLYSVG
jgi:hypothetical protein